MTRSIIAVAVLLLAATSAQAATSVYAEVTYPTSSTWRLWVAECDWQGTLSFVPSGYGIAGFDIEVANVLTAQKMTPDNVFPVGPVVPPIENGIAHCFAGQDTQTPVYGFGVTPWPPLPPGPIIFDGPGAPGTPSPGVLVFGGKRPTDGTVSILWGTSLGNVFAGPAGVSTITVNVVPEPVSLGLLALGLLAVRRRR